MTKHPDFTLHPAAYSNQTLHLQNRDGDVVRLVTDNEQDRAILAGAIETALVLFEVLKKKGA